jgi:hypothetical protein
MSYYDDFVEPNAFFRGGNAGIQRKKKRFACAICGKRVADTGVSLALHSGAKHPGSIPEFKFMPR